MSFVVDPSIALAWSSRTNARNRTLSTPQKRQARSYSEPEKYPRQVDAVAYGRRLKRSTGEYYEDEYERRQKVVVDSRWKAR